MLIERALEKLKQSTKNKTGRSSTGNGARGARPQVPPASPVVPLAPKPDVPDLKVYSTVIQNNKVMGLDANVHDDGRAAAAYRMFRTRVLQKLHNNHWKCLAITSPSPGDGKTLTSLNLALSIARDKSCDVFLLDLDMRKPSICRYLGVQAPHELVDYMEGTCTAAEVFFSVGVDNLMIAGGTKTAQNASELLAGGRLQELIAYAASLSANPVVLIDLPPILVTDEALVVAPQVDAVLLVVAEGKTRRDDLVRARQQLQEFALAGIVLNRASEIADKAGGYYYGYDEKSG